MANTKTAPERWWSLFDRPVDRRGALRAMRDVLGLVALSSTPGCSVRMRPARVRLAADPFGFGVASGEPDPSGAVLWTRLEQSVLKASGLAAGPVHLRWEVAADPGFRRVVSAGDYEARPELGYSVHVEAAGLLPGSDYWYRFRLGDADSPSGRVRTSPRRDAPGRPFRFAFVSCQNYEHGYFTCFDHLASEPVDLVVHLGDYIYEARFSSPDPFPREHESGEVTTLAEYRGRYSTYRRDPNLQRAHAAAPWLVTFDDHEVDNNWAGVAPEDDQSPEVFLLRRAAAFQAYYEFMPLRPSVRPSGPGMRLYREVPSGPLASFFMLDGRQYRTDQPCGDRRQVRCEEAFDPDATMLGQGQEAWLFAALDRSPAKWNILANQVMVSALAQGSPEGVRHSMDRWDGYVAAQNRLTEFLASGRVTNPVIVTGDIHTSWIADVKRDFADPASATVAAEFVGTSIASGGDGRDGSSALPGIQSENPHIHYFDARRGYVVVDVGVDRLHAGYRHVPYVTRPGAAVEMGPRFVVENGVPGTRSD